MLGNFQPLVVKILWKSTIILTFQKLQKLRKNISFDSLSKGLTLQVHQTLFTHPSDFSWHFEVSEVANQRFSMESWPLNL